MLHLTKNEYTILTTSNSRINLLDENSEKRNIFNTFLISVMKDEQAFYIVFI